MQSQRMTWWPAHATAVLPAFLSKSRVTLAVIMKRPCSTPSWGMLPFCRVHVTNDVLLSQFQHGCQSGGGVSGPTRDPIVGHLFRPPSRSEAVVINSQTKKTLNGRYLITGRDSSSVLCKLSAFDVAKAPPTLHDAGPVLGPSDAIFHDHENSSTCITRLQNPAFISPKAH